MYTLLTLESKTNKRFHKLAHTNFLIWWKSTKWFYIQSLRFQLKNTFLSLGDLKMNGNVKWRFFYNHHTFYSSTYCNICEEVKYCVKQDSQMRHKTHCQQVTNVHDCKAACKSKEKWNCLIMVFRHNIRISNPFFTVLQTQKKF